MNPKGIFANNELDLQKIKVYGFDFGRIFLSHHSQRTRPLDYTLARYKSTLHSLIYDHAKTYLVKNLRVTSLLLLTGQSIELVPFAVPRQLDELQLSTRNGRTGSSSRHQTRLADESRQLSQHSARHCLSVGQGRLVSAHHFALALDFSGMRAVSNEEVITAHRGTKLSVDEVGYLGMTTNMFQYVDIFSIPEITLLRDVTQVGNNESPVIHLSITLPV